MSINSTNNINYQKAIQKAIHNSDMQVKEKHVRSVIMGTFLEKGAETFWRVALGFPYMSNKIVAWKLCYVLHKVLREGHSFCCTHSHSHKTDLDKIGKTWFHSDEDFGKIIQIYTKLLLTKMEFHIQNPEFPCHLDATPAELQLIVTNDMTKYFQLLIDMLEYLDLLLQFQQAVFESMLLPIYGVKTWEAKLAPLILCVQESSQLYNHCVRILFILHSYLPIELLEGPRKRFGEQFKQLKLFYANVNIVQSLNSIITVPPLPERTPNFLIEANITLDGLGSDQKKLSHCIGHVDKTPIMSQQNIITDEVMFPKRNGFSEGSMIDLSDSLRLHRVDHQKPIPAPPSLPIYHNTRIENMTTQNAAVPNKKSQTVQTNWIDSFDPSVFDYGRQPIEQFRPNQKNLVDCIDHVDKTPIIFSRNMITEHVMIPKRNEIAEQVMIDLSDSSPLHRVNHQKPIPAPRPMHLKNMAIQNTVVPLKKVESTQKNWSDPFDTSFLKCSQQSTDRPPFSQVLHQIENVIVQKSKTKGNSFDTSGHMPLSPLSHQVQTKLKPRENSLNPHHNSFNDPGNNLYLNVPPRTLPAAHPMQRTNMIPQRMETTEENVFNRFSTSFVEHVELSGRIPLSPVSHRVQTELKPRENSLNPHHTSFNDPGNNVYINVPPRTLPAAHPIQTANVMPQRMETTEENVSNPFSTSFVQHLELSGRIPPSPVSHQVQTEFKPQENSLNPHHTSFNNPGNNGYLNVPPRTLPAAHPMQTANVIPQRMETTEENVSNPFSTSFVQHLELSGRIPPSPVSHQVQIEFKPQENSLNPHHTSFNNPGNNGYLNVPPRTLPAAHPMQRTNMIPQRMETTEENVSNRFSTSFVQHLELSGPIPPSPVFHQVQTELKPRQNSYNPYYTFVNNPCDNRHLNIPPRILPATHPMQTANVIPQRMETTEENFPNPFSTSFVHRDDICRPSAPPLPTVTDPKINVEAIIERDNHIQYLQHELEILKKHNYRAENDNLHKFQEKIISLEKSLAAKENELIQEKQAKMLVNQVPCSPQLYSDRNCISEFETKNSQTFSAKNQERQYVNGCLTQDLHGQTERFDSGKSNDDTNEWDDEDEFDEVQNKIQDMDLENKIRDFEEQIYLHLKSQYMEVWDNNRELFNIKTEILKMNLENLIKQRQADVAGSEEKVKKGNLVNRKIQKFTSLLKVKKIKLKG